MKQNEDGTYQPGVIYELRCEIDGAWHPFYVGETINKATRLGQHKVSANNADETSTLVYRFIHDYLDAGNIEWSLFEVDQYGAEGPEALEDEHIMRLLVEGVALKNTKKGNANWMTERIAVADDMRKRNITSYRKYKEILSYEEQERRVNEANALRVEIELAKQQELTRQEQIRQQVIEQAQQFAEAARKQIERDNAARLERERKAQEAWAADAPARELRLRLETERLQREEAEREAAELKQQQARAAHLAKVDANIALHEEKEKLRKLNDAELLKRAQERMAKILRVVK